MSRFGHGMRAEWPLDPSVLYLNHGTVGATPLRVMAAQQRIREEIERQPSRFMLRELTAVATGDPLPTPRLRRAAADVAAFVGARGEDVVFVENATTGLCAVLRSLPLGEGDEILHTDHIYGAIGNAAGFVARGRGVHVRAVELPHPPDPGSVVRAIEAGLLPRTRLVIVEHITSESALVLPVAEIAAVCRSRGVPILIDGAHAPGALPLDIPSLGVDWYVGNLHKWAYAPRSCGILWAPPGRQEGLHPTVISWGLDRGFTTEFDWQGTHDPTAYLAAPAAVAFLRELGLEDVLAYNRDLVWEAARLLARRWGTEVPAPRAMIGCMATLPLPTGTGSSKEDAIRVRDALLYEDRIEVQLHAWRGRLWTRISAQIYNEMSDYERLADAVLARA
jgi:isopenicillin-N epimerase